MGTFTDLRARILAKDPSLASVLSPFPIRFHHRELKEYAVAYECAVDHTLTVWVEVVDPAVTLTDDAGTPFARSTPVAVTDPVVPINVREPLHRVEWTGRVRAGNNCLRFAWGRIGHLTISVKGTP